MKINLENIPNLIGKQERYFNYVYKLITSSNITPYLVGPSGAGKSMIMLNLLKKYSQQYNVPAYYFQLSPEMTKTTVIMGYRLVNGSLVPTKSIIAEAMENGGIVGIDEATHTTEEMLLMFNSILDKNSITSIGELTIQACKYFKIIFSSNDSMYSGNITLPQSFAQRLIGIDIDYPSWDDEVNISISMFIKEYKKKKDEMMYINKNLIKYITSLMREVRKKEYPLSIRNIYNTLVSLQCKSIIGDKSILDSEIYKPDKIVLQKIYNRIFNIEDNNKFSNIDAEELINKQVKSFIDFINIIGQNEFKDSIRQGFMLNLDVSGISIMKDTLYTEIESKII